MDCQQFEKLAGAYVLGATSELESQAAQAHLSTCTNCQHIVHELQTVTDLLPLAVPAVEPSLDLKKRIMAIVETDAREQTVRRATQRLQQPRWWHYTQTRVAVACLLLLLILVGGLTAWNVSLQQETRGISTSQYFHYKIQSTTPNLAISGEALYLPQLHTTILTIQGVPSLPGTEVYQGWLIKNNHPVSIGLLNIQDGTGTLDFPGDIGTFDAIAVSREPGPQASQGSPHGQIIALGTLQNKQGQIRVQRGRVGI